jgi:hypothetical protein
MEACKHCGQWFNRLKLFEVMWHEIPEHERWTESREIAMDDIVTYSPPDLLYAFIPDLAAQVHPDHPRPKAGSIYRGINVLDVKVKG